MNRTGWEHYELEKELSNSNMAQLLEIFKRENDNYNKKSTEYFNLFTKLSKEAKKEMEDELIILKEGMAKVALEIARTLTDVKHV